MKQTEWNDQSIELIIGNLLRTGVAIAGSVVLFGAVIYLLHHHGELVDYRTFQPERASLQNFSQVWTSVTKLSGRAIIQLGLLLLIATPVARVVFSAFAFFAERDYLYVVLTVIVLLVLAYGLLGHGVH
jgi:uncharacterized membrane protein